jgi:hypothetical protein
MAEDLPRTQVIAHRLTVHGLTHRVENLTTWPCGGPGSAAGG